MIPYLNRLKTISIAITAIASAKMNARIMAMRMRGDADGFLPSALIAANPTMPMMAAGPSVARNIKRIIVAFRIVVR